MTVKYVSAVLTKDYILAIFVANLLFEVCGEIMKESARDYKGISQKILAPVGLRILFATKEQTNVLVESVHISITTIFLLFEKKTEVCL